MFAGIDIDFTSPLNLSLCLLGISDVDFLRLFTSPLNLSLCLLGIIDFDFFLIYIGGVFCYLNKGELLFNNCDSSNFIPVFTMDPYMLEYPLYPHLSLLTPPPPLPPPPPLLQVLLLLLLPHPFPSFPLKLYNSRCKYFNPNLLKI